MRKTMPFSILVLGILCPATYAQLPKGRPLLPVDQAQNPEQRAPADHKADQQEIEQLLERFTRAFNTGEANSVAETFTPDALVVDENGNRAEGRVAIAQQYAAGFTDRPGGKLTLKTQVLRFLGTQTALEEGIATVEPANGDPTETSRFTAIYVKHDGHWLQAAVRDEPATQLSPHDRLKELEWLVGDWVNESPNAIVHTTCKWTEDGNFLVREFTMKSQGEAVLSGSQRIGWDPVRRQFKFWVFDSEGGFGEGFGTRNGNTIVIKAEGVRQDGKHASATTILTRLGNDRMSWQSVHRTLEGQAMAGIDEFVIVRTPPEISR